MSRTRLPQLPGLSRILQSEAPEVWPPIVKLTIRRAEPKDIVSLLALAAFADAEDGMTRRSRMNEESLRSALFEDGATCGAVVADAGGPVIGAVHYHRFRSAVALKPSLWMDDLYVISHYRSQGIGTQLIAEVCRIALEQGCEEIDFTTQRFNRKGLRLYRRLGALVFNDTRYCRLTQRTVTKLAEQDGS